MHRRALLAGLAALPLAGCGASAVVSTGGGTADQRQLELTALIAALGPEVDRGEAARVAQIALTEPQDWAVAWGMTDPPIIHNMKVNTGLRPRGLCREWADDLEARMRGEAFRTLDWHRAIANHDRISIEHSTLIVSAKGAAMEEGLVLDPWRLGMGRLYYGPVLDDPKYVWVARQEVFAFKRARDARRAQ
ncbi:hypothetical protein [Pacificoceanicola onchidii]|uniref:hypothetical protein n=1 Tax=Pacificoceanicola onchidii TaxID=2562685 RepID=UPI0010A6A40B|nr:hypothetical protein [Pacificoceanicola onchidii]